MINLKRDPAPDYFMTDPITRATKYLFDNYEKSGRQERLRFESSLLVPVIEDLLSLSNHKCVYCETRINNISESNIENYRPKAGARGFNTKEYAPHHYFWLAYEWDNLFVSCQTCNQKYKRDFFPLEHESMRCNIGAKGTELLSEKPMLINPCTDTVDEHLEFHEDGTVAAISKNGHVTLEILGLNRSELIEERRKAAENLMTRLSMLEGNTRQARDTFGEFVDYINEIHSEKSQQEFSAVLRTVFEKWYEKNEPLWETLKLEMNDTSKTNISHKKNRAAFSIAEEEEIKEVKSSLSSIKRFSIKTIEILNFKSIESLTMHVKPNNEKDNKESWLLMLGDNAIGKSSILQAIALALSSKKQIEKLKLNVEDFLRHGTEKGRIAIHSFEHDNPVILEFNKSGFFTQLEEAPTFILGYGSTRLLPLGNILPEKNREPYMNIKNLFDYSVALNDPNVWLNQVDKDEFNKRIAPAFFDVLALRGDDKLWINKGKISIQQYGENHDLKDNSDGYKTITALVSDIMQTLSVDKANYHNAQGIVLIDEIGNHLHPRWRMKIASALRKAFPKLQFIVTTHEPLCLRGLTHGEVVVLVRDQENNVKALESDLLPDHTLMRIEQLLTSDLFGLINIMDEETEKTYEEYYQLLSKKEEDQTNEDKLKIEALSSKLGEKEILGSNPRDQMYYKIIDQTYAKNIREKGFKTKEELKKETIEEVKDLITSKNIDWL